MAKGDNFDAKFSAKVEALGGKVRSVHNGAGIAVVTGLSSTAAQSLAAVSGVAEVDADDMVSIVDPVRNLAADALAVSTATPAIDPTKASRYAFQWNMRDINAPAAWAAGKLGAKRVTVAILDTGIDYDGVDLNGLVDLTRSISLTTLDDTLLAKFPSRLPITDFNDHGTNVASQVSSNAIALAGVTAKTTIMAVKVLSQSGSGFTSDVLNGILYAADNGADVANLSLGGSFTRKGNRQMIRVIKRVMDYAMRNGMLVVVAAGNDATDLDHNGDEFDAYCDLQHVMCVSAVGPQTATGSPDVPSIYSNFGRAIDIAAPGGNFADPMVTSNWPWGADEISWVWNVCSKTLIIVSQGVSITPCASGRQLDGFVGTSQASPHVAGLAASMVAQYGKNIPVLIRLLIEASADDLGPRGRDAHYGWGRINVARALGVRPLAH
jgi:subtilisin family serine protease